MEWFLMRFTKGAGIFELIGLKEISKRKDYTIVRPLLNVSKKELLNYLEQKNLPYFIDKSNDSDHYERNRFRKNFSNQLIEEYQEGIKRSFQYLKEDKEALEEGTKEIFHHKEFYLLSYTKNYQIIRLVDKYLKKLGYLLSSAQREELKKESSMVFGGDWAVEIQKNRIFIAPYKTTPMPKQFKEQCRILKIPQKVRAYIFDEKIKITMLPLSS
jgi:tRNA(Ile)-lysidine synthase